MKYVDSLLMIDPDPHVGEIITKIIDRLRGYRAFSNIVSLKGFSMILPIWEKHDDTDVPSAIILEPFLPNNESIEILKLIRNSKVLHNRHVVLHSINKPTAKHFTAYDFYPKNCPLAAENMIKDIYLQCAK